MADEAPRTSRRGGCFVALLLLLAALVAGGWYAYSQDWIPGLSPAGDDPADDAALPLPRPAPRPQPAPEPAGPAATPIAELGCQLVIAAGWERGDAVPAMAIFPVDADTDPDAPTVDRAAPPLVLDKPSEGGVPLFMLGRLPASTLGERDPTAFAEALAGSLKGRLAALQPAPTIAVDGPLPAPPRLFASAREVQAVGAFEELGGGQGTGRFIVGVGADGGVWLAVAFSTSDVTAGEVATMLDSLEPFSGPRVEAESPAEPVPSAAP